MRAVTNIPPSGATIDSPTFTGTFGSGTGAVLYTGTYTPTLSNDANIAASSAQVCSYRRFGDQVFVFGAVNIDPTTATTLTRLGISLPIASNLANFAELAGTAACAAVTGYSAAIYANTASDRASLEFTTATDVAAQNWMFTFSYRIL